MLRRESILLIIPLVLLSLISCRSHSRAEAPANSDESAASDIAQADQFYRQREELTRLEQGIVLLRQATTIDPANYNAEWRLAKFDYYLRTWCSGSLI